MAVRRDARNGHFRKQVRKPDGTKARIYGVPTAVGLPDTKVGALEAERRAVQGVLEPKVVAPPEVKKEVPTLKEFEETYLAVSEAKNKPSTLASKKTFLRMHILPRLGHLRLDEVTYAMIEDFKLALGQQPIGNVTRRKNGEPGKAPTRKLNQKSINNALTVLRRMLSIARKRGLIATVPEVEWYRPPPPEFDFLTFEEADRVIAAATDEWRAMITVALRTGLRLGELMALRWQDVDLVAGRLVVKQNIVRGIVGTPKSGKPREVALSDEALKALTGHRHLRGPLVFCDWDGRTLRVPKVRYAIERACKKAGIRPVGWHVMRHSFASHLAMRGAPLKAIQELLGHATIQMTMRYAHMSPDVARDAVRLLDRRDGVAATWQQNAKIAATHGN
jgi:integrase